MKLHKDAPSLINSNPVAKKIGPQESGTRDASYVFRSEAQAKDSITKDLVAKDSVIKDSVVRDMPLRDALLKETSSGT